MPDSIYAAINFLETQWSSINQNKLKGILAELRLKAFLQARGTYFGPGAWIVVPGKADKTPVPTAAKVCLIPRGWRFSWQTGTQGEMPLSPAELSAYNYFRQVGMQAFFVEPVDPDERKFELPSRRAQKEPARFPTSYALALKQIAPSGHFRTVTVGDAFSLFPARSGQVGLRCNEIGRLPATMAPWNVPDVVSELFWFEYTRFYFQVSYLMSNNDLDMYLIGTSGAAYPLELKSKKPAESAAIGDWFGIDIGPFAKLAYFTANAMHTDALYVVEEVDDVGAFVNWLAIRYTELVKACSWVGQGGGAGMTGGASSTYKIPKAAFSPLSTLLPTL